VAGDACAPPAGLTRRAEAPGEASSSAAVRARSPADPAIAADVRRVPRRSTRRPARLPHSWFGDLRDVAERAGDRARPLLDPRQPADHVVARGVDPLEHRGRALDGLDALGDLRARTRRRPRTARPMPCSISRTRAAISPAAPRDSSASSRTSPATTANPRPASPARAASMAALRASRLVCSAMLRIESTMPPMAAERWPSSFVMPSMRTDAASTARIAGDRVRGGAHDARGGVVARPGQRPRCQPAASALASSAALRAAYTGVDLPLRAAGDVVDGVADLGHPPARRARSSRPARRTRR
jgi:hypothetical protein